MKLKALLMKDDGLRSFDTKRGVMKTREVSVVEFPTDGESTSDLLEDQISVRLVGEDGEPDARPLALRQVVDLSIVGLSAYGDRVRCVGRILRNGKK